MRRKAILILIALGVIGSGFWVDGVQAEPKFLKKEEVKQTMVEWSKALGVKCDYCHTPNRSQTYKELAGQTVTKEQLTALVHQRIAKAMLGYLLYVNQKEGKNDTCNTCHQGKAEVEVK